MKLRIGLNVVLASAIGLVTLAGCMGSKTYTEEEIGLRKSNLYTEDQKLTRGVEYRKDAIGSGSKIERAFDNAPPMIPHDIVGMLPITSDYNACIGCHLPDVAKAVGAIPVPKTHLMNFRPLTRLGASGKIEKDGVEVENTSDRLVSSHDMKGKLNREDLTAPSATHRRH